PRLGGVSPRPSRRRRHAAGPRPAAARAPPRCGRRPPCPPSGQCPPSNPPRLLWRNRHLALGLRWTVSAPDCIWFRSHATRRTERVVTHVQVLVRDNNVDQALRALKKKMQREGIFREMKLRQHYEKPSEKRARERAEAIRRARKLARKKAQREGLLPAKAKPAAAGPRR